LGRVVAVLLFSAFFILVDLYVFQAVKSSIQGLSGGWRKSISIAFWAITALSIIGLIYVNNFENVSRDLRRYVVVGVSLIYFSKIFGVLTLLIDDIFRAGQWVFYKIFPSRIQESVAADGITRSEFMSKASLIAVAVPMATFSFGIASGAHNYRLRKRTIHLQNLPKQFDGITIGQLSDIHSGSFFSRKGVKKGIDLLLGEKPDVVFFTGDLVNDEASELADYKDLFSKVKAPLGVFSTLGNHDYGEYRSWPSIEQKKQNLDNLIRSHKEMGWDILMNENRSLKVDGEEIAIIGVENWGAGRFSKHGDLEKAYQGARDKPVKLLLSHDPSHWDAQIRPNFGDIDVTFAGHTHGFQFGVEIGDFRWSPSKYIYKQWADLHQQGNQYLYVNRGFGFIGYPGRIGILPEVTIIELKRA
jgi:predicted MPP superfamily phosphohydrolase